MTRPSLQILQRQRDDFNARCPVGQRVYAAVGPGDILVTATGSEAVIRSDHTVVVWIKGWIGTGRFHPISRITPIFGITGRRGTFVTDEGLSA